MPRRRFYVPRESIREGTAALPPAQAHHLRDVLRMANGDPVEIFDGAGSAYVGEADLNGPEVFVRNLKSIPSPGFPFHLTLAASLIKPAKFELILQKATELGVDEIIPLKTRHSEIRIPEYRIGGRLERWNRILTEAAKQCRRSAAPRLQQPLDFDIFLRSGDFSAGAATLFYEKCEEPWAPEGPIAAQVILCTGPEGGWAQEEVEQAREAGFRIAGLGPWILRAETAAIAAVAIVQHQIHILRR